MKLKASVSFRQPEGDVYGCDVDIDKDYVEGNADSILEYVSNELYKMFGHSFDYDSFDVSNILELIEELSWDEFKCKTQYANM